MCVVVIRVVGNGFLQSKRCSPREDASMLFVAFYALILIKLRSLLFHNNFPSALVSSHAVQSAKASDALHETSQSGKEFRNIGVTIVRRLLVSFRTMKEQKRCEPRFA